MKTPVRATLSPKGERESSFEFTVLTFREVESEKP
jgi:hypothetical protein